MNFAKKCTKNETMKKLFPINERQHVMEKRNIEKYKVSFASTERYRKSALVQMQHMLNKDARNE